MRYHLRPLQDSPGWWDLEDAEAGMHIRFRECHFNDTQKVAFTDPDAIGQLGAQDDRVMVVRNKFPRFVIHVMDDVEDPVKLGDAIIHAGYFVKKNPGLYREFSEASREMQGEFSDPDAPEEG